MPHFSPRLNRVVESFLPENFDRDNNFELLRAKLVVSYLLFVTLMNIIVSTIGIVQQDLALFLNPAIFALFSAVGLWLIRKKSYYKQFISIFIVLGILNIISTSIDNEGLISPAVYMLLPLPSIALLLGGKKSGILIFSLTLTSFGVIAWQNPNYVAIDRLIMQLCSVLICTIATYVFYYLNKKTLKQVTKSTRELEISNKNQEIANQQLEKANQQLAIANQEQTQINEALVIARKEAEQALEFRSAFLATMSHEIRTPMNGVIGMTSLLKETPLNAEQRDFIDTIRVSGDALLTIINDILDFSKIESGNLELESQPFSVRQCIEEALDLLAIKAEKKHLEFLYHANIPLNDYINGDITRLRQILVNLVNNAIKFTEEGSVMVEVEAIPPLPDGTPQLAFTVRDTGIGIPQDRMDRLFEPFRQVDASTTRNYGGTGLGLAISRRLCEAMGGHITVSSEINQGSSFRFTLPAPPAEAPVESTSLEGLHILVAEPLPNSSIVLAHELELRGAKVTLVGCVDQASPDKIKPHRIVVSPTYDYLPAMLSKLPPEWRTIPILALLHTGESADKKALPANVYIQSKPIKPERIARLLASTNKQPEKTIVLEEQGELSTQLIPLRLLLVEDNIINQKVALRLFERLGYFADVAGNGLEALDALERQQYDVVFMDMQMPEMDGIEATIKIRQNDDLHQPRIIAMTANAMEQDRQRCISAGMDDFVAKPITLEHLVQVLSSIPATVTTSSKSASQAFQA